MGGRIAWAAAPAPVPSATVPSGTLDQFIGESFTIPSTSTAPISDQVCFDNTGNATGYQPAFELITPAGVTFNSATYLGSAVSISSQFCPAAPGNTNCTFTNPDVSTRIVTVHPGETFSVLRFPLGSFTTDQPAQCMALAFTLGSSATAPLGIIKTLTVTPFFDLGADPLDNPATDLPLFGDLQIIKINPTVIKHTKVINAPEDETATGPDYPRTVTLTVDVATGETVNPVKVTDDLPAEFQFINPPAPTGGCSIDAATTATTTTPGGKLVFDCGSITGVAGVDKTITFSFYIPKDRANNTSILNPTTPNPLTITNNSSAASTYLGNPLPSVLASDTITAKAVALQKGGAIVTNTGPTGLSSGDTVEYTLNGQVSDYFTVGNLIVTDKLGDGQTYDASFTPTWSVACVGAPATNGTFTGSNITVTSNQCTATNPPPGCDGTTSIRLDLSSAMGGSGLLAGTVNGQQCTFTIKLRSVIDNAYTGPVSGTKTLSAGDTVKNHSDVAFNVAGGGTITESTSSSLTVAAPTLVKSKYAFNGSTTLPDPFKVGAGDTVTYRLTTTFPVSSVENFKLTDYLPIPLYSLPTSLAGGGQCAGGATPTAPATNAWCYTSSDTVSGTPPPPPLIVTTTPSLNRIEWNYGNRELPDTGGTIDILYTVQATNQPMADRLNLANLAVQSYKDSLSGTEQTAATTTQVITKQPQLAIKKEIRSVTHGTRTDSASVPAGYDAQATGLDAGDKITYRVRITNTGSAPAYSIRLTDDAGTLTTAFGSPTSCTTPTVTLGDESTAVTTSGSLFTTDANLGMTVTPSLAGNGDATVDANEELFVEYTCTLAANATPRTTAIDNTATLRNYSNINTTGAVNFATNPAPLTRKAQIQTQGIQSITKAITGSSLPGSTPDSNINNGETLTFTITVNLSEGIYNSFSLTDNRTTIPTITCGSNGFTCSSNVTTSGSQVTVAATPNSTPGTITYTYSQAKAAGGTNIASVSATNAPAKTATTTWSMDNPNPAISKTLSPGSNLQDGDTVQIRLGWSNTDNNNPMFRCVITDTLDGNVFDLNTVQNVTAPTDYTFAYNNPTVTYTYTPPVATPDAPCPTVAAGGAVFSVQIKNNVVTGTYTNTANIDTYTVPPSVTIGGAAVSASVNAQVPIGAPTVSSKTVLRTSLADTSGSNVAIGEVVTYRLVFRMAEGVTNAVKLIDQLMTGTSTAQLVYIPNTAQLSRSSTSLSAANDPNGINNVAINTLVSVTPTLSGSNLIIDLGNVTNADANKATAESYTLEAQFYVANVSLNSGGTSLQNRAQITYRPAAATADTTVNGSTATVKVVTPQVGIIKTANPTAGAGGDTVTYTLKVSNTATGANAAPAYDYAFSDLLPAEMTPTGTPTANVGTTGATVSSLAFSGQTLAGVIDKLDPGETVTITYQATLAPTVPLGKILVNKAAATATTLPGIDSNERTGSGTGPNTLFAGTNAPVNTQTVTLSKTIKNPKPYYAIGEVVEYELRLAVPIGTATNVKFEDTLPTGLSYVAGSGALSITGGVTTPTAGPNTPSPTSPLTFTVGTVVAAGTAGDVVISYRAKVDNTSANQDGALRINNAQVSYDNPNGPSGSLLTATAPNPPSVHVGEPNLEMTKTILAGAAGGTAQGAGSIVRWQFTVSNNGHTTAHRVAIRDVLPGNTAGLDKLTIATTPNITVTTVGGVSKEAGGPVIASDFLVSLTNRARDTLSATDLVLEPGATLTVAFDTVVGPDASATDNLDNKVAATYNSLPTGTDGRDASNGGDDDNDATLNNYQESASQSLRIKSFIAIDKQVEPVTATIGQTITYRLHIDLIEGTTNSVVVTDVLPAGLQYVSHAVNVGNIGMALTNAAYNTRLGSGQTVSFNLGNVINPANGDQSDDYVEVEIYARVANITTNQNNLLIANGGEPTGPSPVSVSYNDGSPQTVYFDHDATTPGYQGIPFTVTEPVLGVTKTVNPTAQALGDIVTYTLNISHQPASTADAYDVVLVDVIPAGLTYIANSVNPPATFVSYDAGTRKLTLRYDSLPQAEGSRTITYQAQINTSAVVGVQQVNSLTMTWASLPGANGDPNNGRNGEDGPGGLNDYQVTTSTPVTPTASAVIDATKIVTFVIPGGDVNGNGIVDPGDTLQYTVTLKNTGTSPVTNVVFTDPIPANTQYVTGSSTLNSNSAGSFSDDTLTVNVGGLNASATATISFQVTVNAGTPAGTIISNQGVVDSDQTVPEPTDADGNDANGDQPTVIPVGGTQTALYAEKRVRLYQDVNNNGIVDNGDIMEYSLILHNQGSTALTGVRLTDTLPNGLTPVVDSELSALNTKLTVATGQDGVKWESSTTPGAGFTIGPNSSALATFRVTVTDATANSGTFSNQATVNYTEGSTPRTTRTDSNGSPEDGNQPTVFQAGSSTPKLDPQKRWRLDTDLDGDGQPSAGDILYYTITVTNTGAAATNVRLTDPIPANTTLVPNSVYTSQGTITGQSPISVNIGNMATGDVVTVNFRVKIDKPLPAGVNLISNQATVTRTGDPTGVKSDDNGNPNDNGGNPSPTLTPIGRQSAVTKTLFGTSEPVGSTGNQVLIGEVLTYRLTATIPPGTTRQLSFLDTLPAGLDYVAGSATLTRTFTSGLNASLNPADINSATSGSPVVLTNDPNLSWTAGTRTLQLTLGDVINSAATDATYTLEYKVVVQNIAANVRDQALTNTGGIRYWNALSQPQTTSATPVTVTVIEPHLTLTKIPSPSAIVSSSASGQITYTITVRNDGNASAYNVAITDALTTLPTGAQLSTVTTTQVPSGTFGTITNTSSTTNLAIQVAEFPAGGTLTIVAPVNLTLGASADFSNTANTTWTSLPGAKGTNDANPANPGDIDGERTGGAGAGSNGYSNSATSTVKVANPGLTKELLNAQSRYAIGDVVEYRLALSVPAGFTLQSVRLKDVLPAGLSYVTGSFNLVKPTDITLGTTPADFTTTSNTLEANFGNVVNANTTTSQTIVITYKALVANVLDNQDGVSMTNTATLTVFDPGTNGDLTKPITNQPPPAIIVGEPHLKMIKDVNPVVGVQNGDTVTFTITVENNGSTPSYETVLTDALTGKLVGVAGSLTVTVVNGSPVVGVGNFTFGAGGLSTGTPFTLAPGAKIQLTFQAKLTGVNIGDALPNQVSATFSSRLGDDQNERDNGNNGVDQDDPAQNTDPNKLDNYNATATSPNLIAATTVAIDKGFLPQGQNTYTIGELVTYQIKVNVSRVITPDVVVTDVLPAGLSYVSCAVATGNSDLTVAKIAIIQPGLPASCVPSAQAGTGPTTLTFDFGEVNNRAIATDTNPNDEYVLVTLIARVDNILANQAGVSLGNNASVSYTEAGQPKSLDFDADGNPNNGVIEPLKLTVVEPQVTLDKTASPSSVSLGDEVTFNLTLTPVADATGQCRTPAYDLVIKDTLPQYLTYIGLGGSPLPSGVTVAQNGQELTFTLSSALACGAPKTIPFRARLSAAAPIGVALTNNATVTWASQPGATGGSDSGRTGADGAGSGLNNYADPATAVITPTANAVISAAKSVRDVNGGTTLPGDLLEYSITLTNNSDEDISGVVFTDPIPGNTSYVAASSTLNGNPTGSVAGSPPILTVNVGTLKAHASAIIRFQVRVSYSTPNGFVVRNQGSVDSPRTVPTPTDADNDPSNGAQPTETPIGTQTGTNSTLRAEKRVAVSNDITPLGVVNAGDTLRYTIVLRNPGQTALTNLTLTDQVPTGLTYVNNSASPVAAFSSPTLTWSGLSVPANGSLTLTFDATIDTFSAPPPPTEKEFSNQGTVTSPQITTPVFTDGNGDPGDGEQPTVITATTAAGAPKLDLQKRGALAGNAAGGTAVNPGDTVLYTLVVSNTGSATATQVIVTDNALPPQVTLIAGSVLTSRGSVVTESPLRVNVGDLKPGEQATISFRVTVNANTGGQTASNQARAVADNDPNGIASDDNNSGRDPTDIRILRVPGVGSIPTLSEWGMIVLSLLMVMALAVTRRRDAMIRGSSRRWR